MIVKVKKSHIICYIAYFVYIFGMFMDVLPDMASINTEFIKKISKLVAVSLLLFNSGCGFVKYGRVDISKTLREKFTIRRVLSISLFLFVLLVALLSKDFYLLALVLFGMNMQDLDMDELFKVSLSILVFLSCTVLFLCLLGILPNIQLIRSTSYHYGEARYSLGFAHSLVLPDILVYIAVYFYTSKKRMKILDFIVFQSLGVLLYFFCDSRNGLVALEILLCTILIWQFICKLLPSRINKLRKMLSIISALSFSAVSLLSLFLLWAYQKQISFAVKINSVLSNRLMVTSINTEKNPFQMIKILPYQEFADSLLYVYDNGYYYLIARYGYLMMIVVLLITMAAVVCMKKEQNYHAMLAFIAVAMLNFIDNGFVAFTFFPYMLLGICGLYNHVMIEND